MHHSDDSHYICTECYGYVHSQRYRLGYKTCLQCGEMAARQVRHTVAPINKSNYMLISDRDTLKQLNPKRTT